MWNNTIACIVTALLVLALQRFLQHLLLKRLKKNYEVQLQALESKVWTEAFKAGWDSASSDVTNVKASYERIFKK